MGIRDVSRRVSRRRDTSPRCSTNLSTFAGWLLAAVGGICIMAHLFQKALMNLAQQYIVKSLASSPAFQQFALRTVNYAKSLEAQVMRTVSGQGAAANSASPTAAAAPAGWICRQERVLASGTSFCRSAQGRGEQGFWRGS